MGIKKSLTQVIGDFKLKHGSKYDYSKVKYVNIDKKVTIICKIHGPFEQSSYLHIKGSGCWKCSSLKRSEERKKSLREVLNDFKLKHGSRYDYSKVEYKNTNEKVIIICKKHGEFTQSPAAHKKGNNCPKCTGGVKKSKKEIIDIFKKIHGNKYDYSKVVYVNSHTKVKIICKIHGEFEQVPNAHISSRQGCPDCGRIKSANQKLKSKEEIIKSFILKHGKKYNYSKVNYIGSKNKVIIICSKHGEFKQTPDTHLRGNCPQCAEISRRNKKRLRKEEILNRFKNIHGDEYDYSKIKNLKTNLKIKIICKIHGEFHQLAGNHLKGSKCPKCSGKALSNENSLLGKFPESKKQWDFIKNYPLKPNDVFSNSRKKVWWKCDKCSYEWKTQLISRTRKNRLTSCPNCLRKSKMKSQENVIKDFIKIHGNKYDYSKVIYKGNNTNVKIICKKHGEFLQRPANHLNFNNCPKCVGGIKNTQKEMIKKFKLFHGDKYDYSKVNYKNAHKHVIIRCPEHGEFSQTPTTHLNAGCSKCSHYGFDENKIGYLYIHYLFINDEIDAGKIGITNYPDKRLSQLNMGLKKGIFLTDVMFKGNGTEIKYAEEMTKKKFKKHFHFYSDDVLLDGFTETFDIDYNFKIKHFIKSNFKNFRFLDYGEDEVDSSYFKKYFKE